MDVAGEAGTISAVAVCSESDEKYVVLIFVDGLDMKEQMILEDILSEIGRNNNMDNFPAKLPFDEANMRLVNFNKATKQKQDKVPSAAAAATRLSSFPRANPIGVQVFGGGGLGRPTFVVYSRRSRWKGKCRSLRCFDFCWTRRMVPTRLESVGLV